MSLVSYCTVQRECDPNKQTKLRLTAFVAMLCYAILAATVSTTKEPPYTVWVGGGERGRGRYFRVLLYRMYCTRGLINLVRTTTTTTTTTRTAAKLPVTAID